MMDRRIPRINWVALAGVGLALLAQSVTLIVWGAKLDARVARHSERLNDQRGQIVAVRDKHELMIERLARLTAMMEGAAGRIDRMEVFYPRPRLSLPPALPIGKPKRG